MKKLINEWMKGWKNLMGGTKFALIKERQQEEETRNIYCLENMLPGTVLDQRNLEHKSLVLICLIKSCSKAVMISTAFDSFF